MTSAIGPISNTIDIWASSNKTVLFLLTYEKLQFVSHTSRYFCWTILSYPQQNINQSDKPKYCNLQHFQEILASLGLQPKYKQSPISTTIQMAYTQQYKGEYCLYIPVSTSFVDENVPKNLIVFPGLTIDTYVDKHLSSSSSMSYHKP